MQKFFTKVAEAVVATVTAVAGFFGGDTGKQAVEQPPPQQVEEVRTAEQGKSSLAEKREERRLLRARDTDKDGLSDWAELKRYGTDPNKADTDGDGFNDGAEIKAGYDPHSKESVRLP